MYACITQWIRRRSLIASLAVGQASCVMQKQIQSYGTDENEDAKKISGEGKILEKRTDFSFSAAQRAAEIQKSFRFLIIFRESELREYAKWFIT